MKNGYKIMSAVHLFTLAAVAALIGVSQGQLPCYGRPPGRPVSTIPVSTIPVSTLPLPLPYYPDPFPYYPDPCYCNRGDDLSALLLLGKALENSNEVNSNEVINKLLNALIYATTGAGGAGGSGGTGGTGGSGGSGGSCGCSGTKPTTPTPSNPALIDLGLLTGDELISLILGGLKVLDVNVGKGDGGAVTDILTGLL